MTQQPTPPTPAGWHDDPDDPTQIRYWDGSLWTAQRAPKVSSPAPPSGFSHGTAPETSRAGEWPIQRIVAAGGAALVVVGSLMPWATVKTAFGSISINGTDGGGDGTLTLVGGILILALVVLGKYLASLIVSTITTALLVYDFFNVSNNLDTDNEFASASVGWGLIIATLAGLAAVFGAAAMMKMKRVLRNSASSTANRFS